MAPFFTIICAAAVMLSMSVSRAGAGKTNLLSMHLVSKIKGTNEGRFSPPALADVEIEPKPILADKDFVSFDLQKQEFTLSHATAERFSKRIWARQDQEPTLLKDGFYQIIPFPTLFVLKADGEPIYVGLLGSRGSSSSFSGPTILCKDALLSPTDKKDLLFHVDAGYPGPRDADDMGRPNSRRDPRIASAVQKLFQK